MQRLIASALLALLCSPSFAADNTFPTPGNAQASGAVLMCLDVNGKAIPATAAGTCIGSGGGGGGAVTNAGTFAVQNTADGATTDSPCTLPATTTACTMEALAKALANSVLLPPAPITNAAPPTGITLVSGTTAAMTGTTSTQVVAAVTSKVLYITRIKCNNISATATLVQIRDGSAGTVLDTLAAGATFGGEQGTNALPLFWTTSGNGLFAQDVTTGASVICTASGYSG